MMIGATVYFIAPIIAFEGFIMMHDHKYGGGGRKEVVRQMDEISEDFARFFNFGADDTVKKALAAGDDKDKIKPEEK